MTMSYTNGIFLFNDLNIKPKILNKKTDLLP